jgi:hypothetical protein
MTKDQLIDTLQTLGSAISDWHDTTYRGLKTGESKRKQVKAILLSIATNAGHALTNEEAEEVLAFFGLRAF